MDAHSQPQPPIPPANPEPEGPAPGSEDARALAIALQDQAVKAWDIYIKFYTVMLTVNVVALGVVVEKVDDPRSRLFIALAFVVQNAGASVTGLAMRRYTDRIAGQHVELGYRQLAGFRTAGRWGGLGNAISHWVIGILWIALVFWGFVQPPPAGAEGQASGTAVTTTTTTTTTSTTTSTSPESPTDDSDG